MKKQEKQINLKKAELEQQKSIYEKQLEQVNSADYIEKMARQSLRMIMPNEILYVPQEPFLESDDEEELENEEINE
ncbi:MAG: septum formation initiator family protein [Clostridia bacterium]|nr:septum formation initiator family protein [Clostridia bacterium]